MTALLSMLAAKATPYIIGGGAIFAVWLFTIIKALSAGKSIQKAKEADSYEKSLKELADAAVARPSGSVSDDPNNRDR
jgi:hypothetical protein